MDIKSLFRSIHGTIDFTKFQPWRDEDSKKIAEYLGVDEKFLFYNPSVVHGNYFYYDDLFFYTFTSKSFEFNVKLFAEFGGSGLIGMGVNGNFKKAFQSQMEYITEEKDWVELFSKVEKKVLWDVFQKNYHKIPDDIKWEAYKEAHLRAEDGFDTFAPEIENQLFNVDYLKSKERKKRIEKLRKKMKGSFQVFHGVNDSNNIGDERSWTLSREVAKFFSKRFIEKGTKAKIFTKVITINEVIDYFTDRDEEEIILKIEKN